MKAGWSSKSFVDCLNKVTYTKKIQRKEFLQQGRYPIISQEEEFINGRWDEDSDVFSVASPVVLFGDHTKTLKYVDFDFVLGADGVKILSPKDFVDPRFFYYQLQSISLPSLGYARHYRLLKELEISFPPIKEQRRIVAILDEAFEGIATATANAEKNLANAREVFESYLNSVFTQKGEGWCERELSKVCEGKIADGTHQTPKYFDRGFIFLSSKNVTSGRIDWDDIKYIDEPQHIAMQKRVSPRLNDILLAKNGTTGVAAIVDRDVTFDIYVSLALLRASEKILPRYLLHFINSPLAKQQFNKRLKGVGVPNLHLKEIREVVIPFPEALNHQEAVVARLDELLQETQCLEGIYHQKLSILDELKKSILHKAFAGELN